MEPGMVWQGWVFVFILDIVVPFAPLLAYVYMAREGFKHAIHFVEGIYDIAHCRDCYDDCLYGSDDTMASSDSNVFARNVK